ETQVRQVAVVRRRARQPLNVADRVVAGVADRAAGEARQAGHVRRTEGGQLLLQQEERVGGVQLLPLATVAADLRAEGLEAEERPGAEEAVAAQPLAANNALEEERPVPLLDLAEGGDRRECVADELAVDRHETRAPGEVQELFQIGVVAHAGFPRYAL